MTDDFYISRLDPAHHVAEFQALYERCSDYHELEFGVPTLPTAAADDLAYPNGQCYGIYSQKSELIGALELLPNHPKPEEWWIGLLMFDPRARGRGFGTRVCKSTFDWMMREGGRAVWISVLEQNPRAQRFWKSVGFVEKERQDYVSRNGYQSRVILMKIDFMEGRTSASAPGA